MYIFYVSSGIFFFFQASLLSKLFLWKVIKPKQTFLFNRQSSGHFYFQTHPSVPIIHKRNKSVAVQAVHLRWQAMSLWGRLTSCLCLLCASPRLPSHLHQTLAARLYLNEGDFEAASLLHSIPICTFWGYFPSDLLGLWVKINIFFFACLKPAERDVK